MKAGKSLRRLGVPVLAAIFSSACSTLPTDHPLYNPSDWWDSLKRYTGFKQIEPESIPDEKACQTELSVLSYNIRALPLFTGRGEEAFEHIGHVFAQRAEKMEAPDIVLLQEAFHSPFVDKIRAEFKFPYEADGKHKKDKFILDNGSGIEIWSQHPTGHVVKDTFSRSDPFESLARKSVVVTTLDIPGLPEPLYIGTTHMNAGSEMSILDDIREQQIDESRALYDRMGMEGKPFIFAGDFNFKPKHDSYYHMMEQFPELIDAGAFCLVDEHCNEIIEDPNETSLTPIWHTTNDRHFFSASENQTIQIRPVEVIRNFDSDSHGYDELSDHHGYEVRYELSWDCNNQDAPKPPV